VTKRNGSSVSSEPTSTVASVQTPNARHEPIRIRRRPMRSASGAMRMAPSITPKSPALNTLRSAPRARPQSALMAGAR
jgi:hypothetical protein